MPASAPARDPPPGLESLASTYPILRSLAQHLPVGDLISLSRCSAGLRQRTHGLAPAPQAAAAGAAVRPGLEVGSPDTPLWRALKRAALQQCAEPGHTRGGRPGGCRLCSRPVCAACVVKSSFGKNENAFGRRRRGFCAACWAAGTPHPERLRFRGGRPEPLDYSRLGVCRCTATDGTLCSGCKGGALGDADPAAAARCAGVGCGVGLPDSEAAGRVCLWCQLALPGARSKDALRVEYEFRYPREYDGAAALPTYMRVHDNFAFDPASPLPQAPGSAQPAAAPSAGPDRPPRYSGNDAERYEAQRYDMAAARPRVGRRASGGSTKAASDSDLSESTLSGHERAESPADESDSDDKAEKK